MFVNLSGSYYDWERIICISYNENTVDIKMKGGMTFTGACSEAEFYWFINNTSLLNAMAGRFHVFPVTAIVAVETVITPDGKVIKYTLETGANISMGPMSEIEYANEIATFRARVQN